MAHILEDVINAPEPFLLIGDSSAGRFPGFSYNAYTKAKRAFYCLDLGGLKESRGPTKGGPVYASVAELPDDRGELAIIWVTPSTAVRAVDVAREAGARRVWFSFKTGHRDAVAHARDNGMEIVEIGRCPIYYLDDKPMACKGHTAMVKVSGTYKRPPQTDSNAKRRELW